MSRDQGSIFVLGEDIGALDAEALNKMRARVGFLFQSNALYDSMTVKENLEFPLIRHWTKPKREEGADQAVRQALENVGLEHTIDMMPASISCLQKTKIINRWL